MTTTTTSIDELAINTRQTESRIRVGSAAPSRSVTDVLDQLDRHGNIRLEDDGSRVATCETLTVEALSDFVANRTCAIRIPSFADQPTCDDLARFVLSTRAQRWAATDTAYAAGIPVNALSWSAEDAAAYFREALPAVRAMRGAAGGRLTPIDKLRLELDEVWPDGARLSSENAQRRKMFVGLARVMRPEGLLSGVTRAAGIVHTDSSLFISPERGAFSANVYLKVPEEGGELNIFPLAMQQPEHLQDLVRVIAFLLKHSFDDDHRDRVQRKLHALLPPPVSISPRAGDLIILNTGRPHAVRGFERGERVTVQAFMHYRAGSPFDLFS